MATWVGVLLGQLAAWLDLVGRPRSVSITCITLMSERPHIGRLHARPAAMADGRSFTWTMSL
jgi:hypothetical protein